jgi:hypothetical protein
MPNLQDYVPGLSSNEGKANAALGQIRLDNPQTGAGALTQRHGVLIGTRAQRVESKNPGRRFELRPGPASRTTRGLPKRGSAAVDSNPVLMRRSALALYSFMREPTIPSTAFNRRKMEDRRRDAAEKEAAGWTNCQHPTTQLLLAWQTRP